MTAQGGRIGVVGVYAGYCNHYNIGAFMEKGLTMAAGQVLILSISIVALGTCGTQPGHSCREAS